MNPEEIYLQHLREIECIAAFVAKRSHLNADESAEFVQVVRVRILEDDYAIIRKFEGRAKLSTYLRTVIQHLYSEWRVVQFGKWRPSAEAKRLGDKAVTLERLITRDGFTFDEAVKVLTTPAGSCFTVAELEALYVRLPLRNPRPVLVSDENLPEAVSVEADAHDRIETAERERSARTAARTIDDVLGTLQPEDRLLLQMRYWHARKVPEIARMLQIEQKKIYKRLDKICLILRRGLELAGVTKEDIDRLLSRGDQEIQLDLVAAGGIAPFGPSHESSGEEVRGGEGGLR